MVIAMMKELEKKSSGAGGELEDGSSGGGNHDLEENKMKNKKGTVGSMINLWEI